MAQEEQTRSRYIAPSTGGKGSYLTLPNGGAYPSGEMAGPCDIRMAENLLWCQRAYGMQQDSEASDNIVIHACSFHEMGWR